MTKNLTELKKGEIAQVFEIDGGELFHRRLNSMGIYKGKKIKKLSGLRFGGPVIVLVDRAHVAVGRTMAKKIIVKVLKEE